jgi:hypothetical protein
VRDLIQVFAVLAITIGAGLYAYGRRSDPPLSATHPAAFLRAASGSTRGVASVARDWDVGFLALGILSLTAPWLNVVADRLFVRTRPGTS